MDCGIETSPYKEQVKTWPSRGQHIMGNFDDHSIIVYQAYNDDIGSAAAQANNFHSKQVLDAGYSFNRMSWIKTNFLWMMYRSKWASKKNQTKILAIHITRTGFEEILITAAISGPGSGKVRLQWDPDHMPNGNKIRERRAIQLGIKGKMLEKFSKEFITRIDDITHFVLEQKQQLFSLKKGKKKSYDHPKNDALVIPTECVYICLNQEAGKHVNISSSSDFKKTLDY